MHTLKYKGNEDKRCSSKRSVEALLTLPPLETEGSKTALSTSMTAPMLGSGTFVLEGVHSPHPSLYRDPVATTTPPHHSICLSPLHGHHLNTIEDTDVRSVHVWTRRYCFNSTLGNSR